MAFDDDDDRHNKKNNNIFTKAFSYTRPFIFLFCFLCTVKSPVPDREKKNYLSKKVTLKKQLESFKAT